MTAKHPTQADGGQTGAAAPDGVADAPAKKHGKGESEGGAYPNPHDGKPAAKGFAGGQSERAYHGGENPNATAED